MLTTLGWRFEPGDGDTWAVHAGTPCERADLAEAHAAGDLVVQLPANVDIATRDEALRALLHHPATVCAYGFALGAATRRAVDQLVGNRGFRFSALQLGWIGFGPTGAGHDGWEPIAFFGRGYRPRGANSRAIAGFYSGQVRAECGVGRQIAQYATQAELYGMDAFDTEFAADEIVIGTFHRLAPSRSILLGSSAGTYTRDGLAREAAARGRQAFVGVPGFIYHVFDRSTLDDIHNQAENFVVYDVSPEAAAALRAHGGFEYYNDLSRDSLGAGALTAVAEAVVDTSNGCCTNATPHCAPTCQRRRRPPSRSSTRCWPIRSIAASRSTCTSRASSRLASISRACSIAIPVLRSASNWRCTTCTPRCSNATWLIAWPPVSAASGSYNSVRSREASRP